jgi:hypothetical protein
VSVTVSVELRAVSDLAEELAVLAAELATEVDLCRSATSTVDAVVDGETAASAHELGAAWAGLVDAIARGTDAVAVTLRAAVHSYRLADAALSDRLLYVRAGVPVP